MRDGGPDGPLALPTAWPRASYSPSQCLSPHPVNGAVETVLASSMSRGGSATSGKGFVGSRRTDVSAKRGFVPGAPTLSDTAALRCPPEAPGPSLPLQDLATRSAPAAFLHFKPAPWEASQNQVTVSLHLVWVGPASLWAGSSEPSTAPPQSQAWVHRTGAGACGVGGRDGDPRPGLSRAGRACCTAV